MGFFTDLKDDLAQAVNELMPEEENANQEADTQVQIAEDADNTLNDLGMLLDRVDNIDLKETETKTMEKAEELYIPEPKIPEKKSKNVLDETAVITAGMVVKGDISTEGSMDLVGTIVGNIDVLGKLNVTGTIQGNSKADEIYAENAKITGEVNSKNSVKIGQSTVVIGNIFANSAVIAGAVKGDIDVHGPVVLDTSAIIMGNIKSKAVQINNGAVIEGMCSQCYADVNPTAFFEGIKNGKGKK